MDPSEVIAGEQAADTFVRTTVPANLHGRSTGATAERSAERIARYLSAAPTTQKLTLAKALQGTASPRQAIKAQCLDCCAFDREEVRLCPAVTCALHAYRPFQQTENHHAPNGKGSAADHDGAL